MKFRTMHGYVRRTRFWWIIDYVKYLDQGGTLLRKRHQSKLTPVLPEHGCMLLPPADVQKAREEFMEKINQADRELLARFYHPYENLM